MPLPKKKYPRHRTRMRRSHQALKVQKSNVCPHCQAPILPHRACSECGFYKNRPTKKVSNASTTPKKK